MKTVTRIVTKTENVQFGFWDTKKGEFVPIDTAKVVEVQLAMKHLSCSEEFISALGMWQESLIEAICQDLEDIWKRLDARA